MDKSQIVISATSAAAAFVSMLVAVWQAVRARRASKTAKAHAEAAEQSASNLAALKDLKGDEVQVLLQSAFINRQRRLEELTSLESKYYQLLHKAQMLRFELRRAEEAVEELRDPRQLEFCRGQGRKIMRDIMEVMVELPAPIREEFRALGNKHLMLQANAEDVRRFLIEAEARLQEAIRAERERLGSPGESTAMLLKDSEAAVL